MRLLIIGGTAFVGRALAEAALQQGHELSLFHRGKTNPDFLPQVEHLHGDRATDVSLLTGRTWDVVIDTCGYVPRVVGLSAETLRDFVGQYCFISTISVYADLDTTPGIDEDGALASLDDPTTEIITGETYGGLKVLCEQVVQTHYPNRALIIRPGLIVGPHDYTHRYAYWLLRMAAGGEMLAPNPPEQPMQVIDVRDLATFTLNLIQHGKAGVYNATGHGAPLSETLNLSREITGANTHITWVEPEFLVEKEVPVWTALPLWMPPKYMAVHRISIRRALAEGLHFRSLRETLADTYAWLQAEASSPNGQPLIARGALTPEQEAELLHAWHTQTPA